MPRLPLAHKPPPEEPDWLRLRGDENYRRLFTSRPWVERYDEICKKREECEDPTEFKMLTREKHLMEWFEGLVDKWADEELRKKGLSSGASEDGVIKAALSRFRFREGA